MGQQLLETFVRLLRTSQAREHSHGPEPSSIHGRLDSSGERIDARETDVTGIIDVFCIFRRVQAFNLQIGDCGKTWEALRGFTEDF